MRHVQFSLHRLARSVAALVMVSAIGWPMAASAQQPPKEWSLQLFRPALHSFGGFTVEGARVSHGTTVNAYMMANYAGKMLKDAAGSTIVDDFATVDFVASVALIDRISIGIGVPLHAFRRGTFLDGQPVKSTGIGDMRVSVKAALFKPHRLGAGMGLQLDLVMPTGARGGYGGEESLIVEPKLLIDYMAAGFHMMTNIFLRSRTERFNPESSAISFADDLRVGSEFGISAGLAVFLGSPKFRLLIEGRFQSRADRFFAEDNTQLEFTAGLHWRHASGFAWGAAGGFGVLNGYGDPQWRAALTLGYQPVQWIDTPVEVTESDLDGDGIPDAVDQCPKDAEDMDGDRDEDGCPDTDMDGDGIDDTADLCPRKAEDIDGDRDEDGCPDGDGDKDGIADDRDRCPARAEDVDGFEDDDGCPDPDNDKDGIIDARDKCPLQTEDADGFQDDDGCPEPDNDGDGIADVDDRCPDKAEDFDGCQDGDGCPEEGSVCLTADRIEIRRKIYFKTGKARLLSRSYGLLGEVAEALRANPQLEMVEIQGHTDSRGGAAANQRLSKKRAEAVYRYLVMQRGADPGRLRFKGFGETSPIAENTTRAGREQNRRVEFVIIKQTAPAGP